MNRNLGYWKTIGRVLFIFASAIWVLVFSPSYLGGPATYVVVLGDSMEPSLSSGDLVVALKQDEYSLGDAVVFGVELNSGNQKVVHSLYRGDPLTGWQTKGINKDFVDPWIVTADNIAGKVQFVLPSIGFAIIWVLANPLWFATLLAFSVLVLSVLGPRKLVREELKASISNAKKENWWTLRQPVETAVFISIAVLFVGVSLFFGLVSESTVEMAVVIPVAAAFAINGLILKVLAMRLLDGKWISEPISSKYALSGRTYFVDKFPPMEVIQQVDSAIALRDIAEKYRLPILHRINPKTGFHEYMLITVQKGTFLYIAREKRIRGSFNRSMNKTLA